MTRMIRRKLRTSPLVGAVAGGFGVLLAAIDVRHHAFADDAGVWAFVAGLVGMMLGGLVAVADNSVTLYERLPVTPARIFWSSVVVAALWEAVFLALCLAPRWIGWAWDPPDRISSIDVVQASLPFPVLFTVIMACAGLAGLGLGLLVGSLAVSPAHAVLACTVGCLVPFVVLVTLLDSHDLTALDFAPLAAALGILFVATAGAATGLIHGAARDRRITAARGVALALASAGIGAALVAGAVDRWTRRDEAAASVGIDVRFSTFAVEAGIAWLHVGDLVSKPRVVSIDIATGLSTSHPPGFDFELHREGSHPVFTEEDPDGDRGPDFILRRDDDGSFQRILPVKGAAPEDGHVATRSRDWAWSADRSHLAFIEDVLDDERGDWHAWAVVVDSTGQSMWRQRCAAKVTPPLEWLADGRLRATVAVADRQNELEASDESVMLFDPAQGEARSARWPGGSLAHDARGDRHLVTRLRQDGARVTQSLALVDLLDGGSTELIPESDLPETAVADRDRRASPQGHRWSDRLSLASRWSPGEPPAVAVTDGFTQAAALVAVADDDALATRVLAIDLATAQVREVRVEPPLPRGTPGSSWASGLPRLVAVTADGSAAIVRLESELRLVHLATGESSLLGTLHRGPSSDFRLSPSGRKMRELSPSEVAWWLDETTCLVLGRQGLDVEVDGHAVRRMLPP